MKKYKVFISFHLLIVFILYFCSFNKVTASTTNYKTFSEIVMSSGKLLSNFTKEETQNALKKAESFNFNGLSVYYENKNVKATYISNTLFSVYNDGDTPLKYDIQIVVETNNKVSFGFDSETNIKLSGTIKKIKADLGNKTGVSINATTTKSVTDKRTLSLSVGPNNRCCVYLTGDLSVSNGAFSYYLGFIKITTSTFELVVLNNQYAHYEIKPIKPVSEVTK